MNHVRGPRKPVDSNIRPMNTFAKATTSTIRICLSLATLMVLSLTQNIQAQQNPYPFDLNLSFGGGLIGNSDVNTTFQPELGFSYMPDKFGFGLNAGLLTYESTFDGNSYATGFEDYTSVSWTNKEWSSFFLGAGPRVQFGSGLPVTFRGSLDLSLTYNAPPSISVDFNDPDGTTGDTQLQLSDFDAGDDYRKWSAAIRPEFQMQFSPGGSDRFAITVATGFLHRLSKNEFTYTQKDLSNVRAVPSAGEMLFQFQNAPDVQRTASPPQTNFFTTVGIRIKFEKSSGLHNDAVIHRDIATRSAPDNTGSGDCDDGDVCAKPGEASPGPYDEFNHEAKVMARLASPTGIIAKVGGGENPLYTESGSRENELDEGQSNQEDDTSENAPQPMQTYKLEPGSYCVSLSTMRISTNSQKAMRRGQNGDIDSDSDGVAMATSHNASRSNRSQGGVMNDGGDPDIDADSSDVSPATSHNASRSNRSQGLAGNGLGGDLDGDGFPDILKDASLSISKRSARTGRSPIHEEQGNNQTNPLYESEETSSGGGGDMDGDGYGDAAGLHFEFEINDKQMTLSDLISGTGDPSARADTSANAPPGLQVAPSQTSVIVMGITDDGDIVPLDEARLKALERNNDPDSDADGLMDAFESASYSFSYGDLTQEPWSTEMAAAQDDDPCGPGVWARTTANVAECPTPFQDDDPCGPGVWARTTGGAANCTEPTSGNENTLAQETGWEESPADNIAPPNDDVLQWTYKLNALSERDDLPGNGTLTVMIAGGEMHINVHFDSDSDEDGYGELLRNSSFSISKRSARTGRN